MAGTHSVIITVLQQVPFARVLVGSVTRIWELGKGTMGCLSLLHHGGLQYSR